MNQSTHSSVAYSTGVKISPRTTAMKDLRLKQANDRFGERVVVRIADLPTEGCAPPRPGTRSTESTDTGRIQLMDDAINRVRHATVDVQHSAGVTML